jgi:hypothetical protein
MTIVIPVIFFEAFLTAAAVPRIVLQAAARIQVPATQVTVPAALPHRTAAAEAVHLFGSSEQPVYGPDSHSLIKFYLSSINMN